MKKMWAGRTSGELDKTADDFNSSIGIDSRMYRQDIEGSIAHAAMLGIQGIIPEHSADRIIDGLGDILRDIDSGELIIDPSSEDIHMFIEDVLTERIGDEGKMLHTARSRNDQVALDTRMYVRNETVEIKGKLISLISALCDIAEEYKYAVMPGYTHMQRAQPVTFGHHMMAYAMMLLRDAYRADSVYKNANVSPIGCCALAGTTYDTDRYAEARALGFDSISLNSLDGVSDRDFCIEFINAAAMMMMHMSRFSEELVLWSSWEFRFIEISDSYTTGSSIMPQKKNPDMAELIRGKTGRVYGDLVTLLTLLKGLPLAYNKDMQEDKEAVFDASDTVKQCLDVLTPMIKTMRPLTENMHEAAGKGFINATDMADYLVKKGLPFRDAYKISGHIVADCISDGMVLETVPIEKYREYSDLFDDDIYSEIDLANCVAKRISEGGTSAASVEKQIDHVRKQIREM